MAKTQEELNKIKEEDETVSEKLHALTEDELAQVAGGILPRLDQQVDPEQEGCSGYYPYYKALDKGKINTCGTCDAYCGGICTFGHS